MLLLTVFFALPALADVVRPSRINNPENALLFKDRSYWVADFGAKGDGQRVENAAMTTGRNVLTSVSGLFTAADVGKSILVNGAGAFGGRLSTTIATYTSATTVTLEAPAASTVSAATASWGHDDTVAIQTAIDTVYNGGKGCGTVMFSPQNYYTRGTLTLPPHVHLDSPVIGPFEPHRRYPAWGPAIWITNESETFLFSSLSQNSVSNLIFYYPNQVNAYSNAPFSYPYTITIGRGTAGFALRNCTIINAYDGIKLDGGRWIVEDIALGALDVGIYIDHNGDYSHLRDIHMIPYWDTLENLGGGLSALSNWVMGNQDGWALIVNRVDHLVIDNFECFWKYGGMKFQDSPDKTQNPRNSYGFGSNINLDFCVQPVVVKSTNVPGWKFTNLDMANHDATYPNMQLQSGGWSPPIVYWTNGRPWGNAVPVATVAAGELHDVNVAGLSDTFRIFPDAAAQPSVAVGSLFKASNTVSTTITSFLDGWRGKRITVVYTNGNTTIVDIGNIVPSTTAPATNMTIEYVFDGAKWYEVK